MTSSPRLAAAAVVLALSGLAACSGGVGDGDSSAGSAAESVESGADAGADAGGDAGGGADRALSDAPGKADDPQVRDGAIRAAQQTAQQSPGQAPDAQRAVISTGTVDLRSGDVEQARFDVQRVVDAHGGEVSDERTGTDREGVVRRSRLVLRVPVGEFDAAMGELGEVADLRQATRTSEDVTTQVIDTEVRVRAQRASLERVEALLADATKLGDVVAIEAQLTRRQSELDSLEQRQAYLADQTSLSTITVTVQRTRAPREAPTDEAGFLAGLSGGWDALRRTTTAALTAVGALLPFAAVLVLVGAPLLLLARRLGSAYAARGDRLSAAAAGAAGRSASAPPDDRGPSPG